MNLYLPFRQKRGGDREFFPYLLLLNYLHLKIIFNVKKAYFGITCSGFLYHDMPVSLLGVSNRLFNKIEKAPCPAMAYILEITKRKEKTWKQIK